MTDLSAIRAKVYAATTEQHVPVLTRYEARLLFGRIEALEGVLKKAVLVPEEIRAIMGEHDIVFDKLNDPMRMFAFTLYTELCRAGNDAEAALEVPDELK